MTQPFNVPPGEIAQAIQGTITGFVEDREISNALMAVLRRHGIDISRTDRGYYEVVTIAGHNASAHPVDTVGEAATYAIQKLAEKLSGANTGA